MLSELNPGITDGKAKVPALRLEQTDWIATFDQNLIDDKTRSRALAGSNKSYRKDVTVQGKLIQKTYQGFYADIEAPKNAQTEALLAEIAKYDPVLQKYSVQVEEKGKPLSTGPLNSTTVEWWERCRAAQNVTLPKPPYITLLGASKNLKCVRECKGDACPEIVLIDNPVAEHPDLLTALGQTTTSSVLAGPPSTAAFCPYAPWDKSFHGTHLAGIMVSDGGNSYEGLAPSARLTSVDRSSDVPTIRGVVTNASRAGHPVFFVFASQFDKRRNMGVLPPGTDRRFSDYPLAPQIRDSSTLWIVAAGEPNAQGKQEILDSIYPDRRPVEITPDKDLSPMHLGDQKNVLVVTACEDCLGANAKVADWANYSKKYVGVAAPGGSPSSPLPSTATTSAYSVNYGTSQSAAIAGGLAAAMYACYSSTLGDARMLKLRMEQTSRPFNDSNPKIATGMLDAQVAMLDPKRTWVRAEGQDWRAVSELKWCKKDFVLQAPSIAGDLPFDEAYIGSKNLRRLTRIDFDKDSGNPLFSIFGEINPDTSTNLVPRGPAMLADLKTGESLLQIRFEGESATKKLAVEAVEDVILASKYVAVGTTCK